MKMSIMARKPPTQRRRWSRISLPQAQVAQVSFESRPDLELFLDAVFATCISDKDPSLEGLGLGALSSAATRSVILE